MKFKTATLQGFIGIVLFLLISSFSATGQAPTHTPKFTAVHPIFNGFWEYLPRNYNTDTDIKYPLLIFIHGAGERGDEQNYGHMMRVLAAGVPRVIEDRLFPDSFQVNSKWYKFIVLSPQIESNQGFDDVTRSSTVPPDAIDALIDFAKANYRIDTTKIYLTGLSMGGGTTWNYAGSSRQAADRLAGIIVAAGAYDLSTTEANNIALSNLPVIATHNNDDLVIGVDRTANNISRIVSSETQMSTPPRAVYWPTGGHNVWERTFEELTPGSGNLVDTLGMTAYNWALQFSTATSSLPVVWKDFTAVAIGQTVQLKWIITNQVNVKQYIVQRSPDGRNYYDIGQLPPIPDNGTQLIYQYSDKNPPDGELFYRIYQTDLDGKTSYSTIKTVRINLSKAAVLAFPNPFTSQLTIKLKETSGIVEVKLQDAQGRVLRMNSINSRNGQSEVIINGLNQFGAGMYYMVIYGPDGKVIDRLPLLKQ